MAKRRRRRKKLNLGLVIGVSVGTILLFSGLFAVAQPIAPYETPLGYLILSLESFITLVLGGAGHLDADVIDVLDEAVHVGVVKLVNVAQWHIDCG